MNRVTKALAVGTLSFVGGLAALAQPPAVSADPTSACPDHFVPVPVVFLPDGAKKDRNGDFIVCGKAGQDGSFHAGPDDQIVDNNIV